MNSIMIRQIIVEATLVAILCVALLMGMLVIRSDISGVPVSQTGIMLIGPSYITPSHQLVDLKVMVTAGL